MDTVQIDELPTEMQNRIGEWGYDGIGRGWLPIIVELDRQLAKRCPDYKIDQIKEKFGGLRYYVTGVDDEGYELIDDAEAKTRTICEECGAPGKVTAIYNSRWLKCVCNEHAEMFK